MNISRNADWDMAEKRLEAFWSREIIDRPCIQIYAPAPPEDCADAPSAPTDDYEKLWNDPETVYRNYRAGYMRQRFLGEALPVYYPNWVGVPQMLGSNVQYDRDTIWVRPTVDTILDIDPDSLRVDHPLVTKLIEKLDYLAMKTAGDAFIGLPPMANAGDHLAMTCGYANLCMDLIENTDAVMAAERKIKDLWISLYDRVYETINRHQQGSCGWLPAWHPRRSALLECDFCAMISPQMFDMYLPLLLERASHCERSIYHLDGPGALTHLDTLLAQKEIDAIQWEPGVACKNILEYLPVMQKIQAAGKGLYVAGPRYSPEAMLALLRNLRPEGLIIPVSVQSLDEGERLLDTVTKMFA